jgi:ABC-type uncharacterized transport system permease subunit
MVCNPVSYGLGVIIVGLGSTIATDHLQMKISRGRHLSAAFLWLGAALGEVQRSGLIPKIRTILKSSFALLW